MRMVLLLGWFQNISITFAFFKVAMASASGGSINSAGVFFAMLSNLAFCCSSDAQSFYVWIFVNMIKHRSSFLVVVTTCTKFYLWSHCLFLLSFCRCVGNTSLRSNLLLAAPSAKQTQSAAWAARWTISLQKFWHVPRWISIVHNGLMLVATAKQGTTEK